MKQKLFLFWLGLLLIGSLVLKIILLQQNNLFFTVDQGRDAVYVREILQSQRTFLKGPETSVRGVFAGPLWYYFVALGYLLTAGHPVGGIYVLIFLNLITTTFLVLWLKMYLGEIKALLVGFGLQIFWPFFENSLWSFNPFPTVALTIFLLVFLIWFLLGQKNYYFYLLLLIILAFNTHLAGALVLLIFYVLIGFWGYRKSLLSIKAFLISALVLPGLGLTIVAQQFIRQFLKTKTLSTGAGLGVFRGVNFLGVGQEFLKILGQVVIPQNYLIGILGILIFIFLYQKQKKKDKTINLFLTLTCFLILISFLFFGSNMGWRAWHTVYLAPLVFISLILGLIQLRKKGYFLIALILGLNFINFVTKYQAYLIPSPNPSLLYNELATIDWIYQAAEDQGFKVYNYTNTFKDYPYQYLFWWYGLKKYGYLPEEYSNYPLSAKETYVPGAKKYIEPKRSGEYLKFLIIQSPTNGEENADWPETFKKYHHLVEEKQIGDIKIEKYRRNHDAPNDPCIWQQDCLQI